MNLLENRSRCSRLRAFTSFAVGSSFLLATCVLCAGLGLKLSNAQSLIPTINAPPGWFLAGSKPSSYQTSVDKTMTQNGLLSAYLKSIVPVTDGFGTLMQQFSARITLASEFACKRGSGRRMLRSGLEYG